MTDLHTRDDLLKKLREGTTRELSHAQLVKQRLSFVVGSLDEKNNMTREQIQTALEKREGRKLAAG